MVPVILPNPPYDDDQRVESTIMLNVEGYKSQRDGIEPAATPAKIAKAKATPLSRVVVPSSVRRSHLANDMMARPWLE